MVVTMLGLLLATGLPVIARLRSGPESCTLECEGLPNLIPNK
jgi:hypothetical protein